MKSTSLAAYRSILKDLGQLHSSILDGLLKIGSGTFREIASASGLRESQVWKRLSELKNKGYIQEVDTKKCPISGRVVTVWSIIQ